MSRELYVGAFESPHTSLHNSWVMDVPKILRALLDHFNVTQTELAAKLGKGVSQPQISRWLKGSEPERPNFDRIMRLAASAGVIDDVRSEDIAATTDKPAKRMLRVRGYVGASDKWNQYSDIEESDLDEIEASDKDPEHAAAAVIRGKSLGDWFNKWHAIYGEVRSPITEDMIGELCVVWLKDGRALVKKVMRNNGRFDLYSNRKDVDPIRGVEIESAAVVTDIRKG